MTDKNEEKIGITHNNLFPSISEPAANYHLYCTCTYFAADI